MLHPPAMKAAKLLVLLAGVLGVAAFFLPMATVSHEGQTVSVSAFQLFTGVQALEDTVSSTDHVEGMTADELGKQKRDVTQTLAEIKGVVLACFLPGALLAIIGGVALVRRRFGRVGGAFAVLLGVVGLLVFTGLNAGADAADGAASRGVAMYLLLGTGLLGVTGGLLALVKPERPAGRPA